MVHDPSPSPRLFYIHNPDLNPNLFPRKKSGTHVSPGSASSRTRHSDGILRRGATQREGRPAKHDQVPRRVHGAEDWAGVLPRHASPWPPTCYRVSRLHHLDLYPVIGTRFGCCCLLPSGLLHPSRFTRCMPSGLCISAACQSRGSWGGICTLCRGPGLVSYHRKIKSREARESSSKIDSCLG